nr:MAG: replication initiation protein [Microvirus sp.]
MPCYKPLSAYRSTTGTKLVFDKSKSKTGIELKLACGQCIGCRLERSRHWAIRCIHEASLYDDNCFITLTYNDDHLPHGHTLIKSHFQKFMKRLRKKYQPKTIRYYQCGEYGEATPENGYIARPHYHACLFNFTFEDLKPWKQINENLLFTSQILTELWPYGYSSVGSVTFESAAYVARYIMKKINGDLATKQNDMGISHYDKLFPETGEVVAREPEYTNMSRRPGIGKPWYDKFKTDVYPSDFITHRGNSFSPPQYYDYLLDLEDPSSLEDIKHKRQRNIIKHAKDLTPERLITREKVKNAQLAQLKRKL